MKSLVAAHREVSPHVVATSFIIMMIATDSTTARAGALSGAGLCVHKNPDRR